ncbi:MAG: gamma-glutamyltransferase [Pseudomonadota bacterium]|nr:gamma-glutamyltransferase [Pseudomonadota bacterium]
MFRAPLAALLLVLAASAAPAQPLGLANPGPEATAQAPGQAADAVAPEGAGPDAPPPFADDPEIAAALAAKAAGRPVRAETRMVVAAHPLAAKAGLRVLRAGGTAADAMVAVQAVLGLVEPQSSGLGGGAFLVWFDAETGALTTLDGRETAPLAARPKLFLDADGEPLDFFDAVVGGLSVGTPGTPALMGEAHRRWGRRDWAGLFEDAIDLATEGFPVSPRLAGAIAEDAERLATIPATAAYFLPEGVPPAPGAILRNPAYARTLARLALGGAEAFYGGEIAANIVKTVRDTANPGRLSETDLALYRVVERPPVCVEFRGREVCGMGPPSSGALTVGQVLGMLRGHDLAALGPDSAEAWRLVGDASRLAFADRGRFMADVDFVPMPSGLTDDAYLAERAALLAGPRALETVAPGRPGWDHARLGDDASIEFPSTSHISIVDGFGNALSMTTTIENGFGSRLMTPDGFLLNNELTDFSFATRDADGRPIANRVEPGKRPRSSMAPTIVMRDGRPELVIGSPGGSRIIGYVLGAVLAHVEWGMDAQAAVSAPHLVNRFGRYDLEAGTAAEALAGPLEALGYEVRAGDLNSGLHAIAIGADGLEGGADPRREGVALGD